MLVYGKVSGKKDDVAVMMSYYNTQTPKFWVPMSQIWIHQSCGSCLLAVASNLILVKNRIIINTFVFNKKIIILPEPQFS